MKIEHFALNVEDPIAMAAWYSKNMGLTIVKEGKAAPFMHFLADDSGRVMIEIYKNPPTEVHDYRKMNPLIVHLAFVSVAPDQDRDRLLQQGATVETEQKFEDGTYLIMMRDPWGLAIQLCKRGVPMLSEREKGV